MAPENNVGLGGCWISEQLLSYLIKYGDCMMARLERISDNTEVSGLERFHCGKNTFVLSQTL